MSTELTESRKILVIDDDTTFSRVLSRAFGRRGFECRTASSAQRALDTAVEWIPQLVTLDLKLNETNGLSLIPELRAINPEIKILVLTGYASIATAVEAIKLGATQYLPKPADADQILAALLDVEVEAPVEINETPLSVGRLEWEHIQSVLMQNDGNISATARALGMHRRTLQRKLAKHPVKS